MKKHFIKTQKTGRYFTLGELNENTKYVIFTFHGYAQNADEFLKDFEVLLRKDTFIVAPEGLSHFYWKDMFGKPVSSWMTSLEREKEIEDVNAYLDRIFNQLFKNLDVSKINFHFLAFSQSGPILSRWLDKSRIKAKNLFFYASEIARETYENRTDFFFNGSNLFLIHGDEDRLMRKDLVENFQLFISDKNIIFESYVFKGRHEIEKEALQFINFKIYTNE